MKLSIISSAVAITALSVGAILYFQSSVPESSERTAPLPAEPEIKTAPPPLPKMDIRAALPNRSEPLPTPVAIKSPPEKEAEPTAEAMARAAAAKKQREMRHWQQHIRNFDRQLALLNNEKNPARRKNLIQSLSRYVQVDTLGTIEWAMNLEDPEERVAALTALNKNALTGIGAHIEVGETGLPKIRETTLLSAIDSTGLVEEGDYIAGMMKADGSIVQFKGLPLQQAVQKLRGKPGTEVQLMMERISPDGVPFYFNVPVQRSLIVVQPPN